MPVHLPQPTMPVQLPQMSPLPRGVVNAPAVEAPIVQQPPIDSPNGTPWTQLPSGKPIPVRNGYAYYVVTSVKTTHSAADIKEELWPLTFLSFTEEPASGGYRKVTFLARAKQDAPDAPWGAPSWYPFDDTTTIVGWYSPPAGKGALPPTEESSNTGTIVAGVVGVAAVGSAGWFGWRWWKHRKTRTR